MSSYPAIKFNRSLEGIQLLKLAFVEMHSSFHLDNYGPGEIDINIENHFSFSPQKGENMYTGIDKYEITGSIKGKRVITLNLELLVVFGSETELDPIFLEMFETRIAKVITYPYVRQAVSDITAKMGLPPLVLPLWRISPVPIKRKKK